MVNTFNPLEDSRWGEFLSAHPQATVFQTTGWLSALRKTYGYEPIGYTTSAADEALDNAVVLCRVESWVTGRRLVSLPFSDHCSPLVCGGEPEIHLAAGLAKVIDEESLDYIEIRPVSAMAECWSSFVKGSSYAHHLLDLRPEIEAILKSCHKDSTQRKIQRAERDGLVYEEGSSSELLGHFYQLFVETRRRHGNPPPPKSWFWNLIEGFGDGLKIRVAYLGGQPTAAIVTLRFKDTLVYKYGASDVTLNRHGGTQWLMWKAIEEAKRGGLRVFDLGRSDLTNSGLITFKNRWGAVQTDLNYYRLARNAKPRRERSSAGLAIMNSIGRRVVAVAPSSIHRLIGRVVYRHIG